VRLSFADTGFAALDALEGVDAGCLFVCEDERPLKGMAGCIDWRLCGMLSRLLQEGRFIGSLGDALLFAGFGRLRPERLFCFGGGRQGTLQRDSFAKLVPRRAGAVARRGSGLSPAAAVAAGRDQQARSSGGRRAFAPSDRPAGRWVVFVEGFLPGRRMQAWSRDLWAPPPWWWPAASPPHPALKLVGTLGGRALHIATAASFQIPSKSCLDDVCWGGAGRLLGLWSEPTFAIVVPLGS
jgi:hypothetical protein